MAEIVKKRALEQPELHPPGGVIESEVFDASRKARTIVLDAETKGEQILADAKKQGQHIKEEARAQGFKEGKAEGLRQYQETIVRCNQEHETLLRQAEEQLVQLATGVAEKVVQQELKVNPGTIVGIVRKALGPMSRKRNLTIRVNPLDRKSLEANRPQILEALVHGGHVVFLEDPDITRGGCFVETEHGTVDARLETQLSVLNHILTGNDEPVKIVFDDDEDLPLTNEISKNSFEEESQPSLLTTSRITDVENATGENAMPMESSAESHYDETETEDLSEEPTVVPKDPAMMAEIDNIAQSLEEGQDINDLLSQMDEFLGEESPDKGEAGDS